MAQIYSPISPATYSGGGLNLGLRHTKRERGRNSICRATDPTMDGHRGCFDLVDNLFRKRSDRELHHVNMIILIVLRG